MPDYDPDFHAFTRSADADAFRRLVARHVDAVHSAARRILDDRADAAADVAQAVFILLARRAAALPEDLVVGGWLHRQTVRLALKNRVGVPISYFLTCRARAFILTGLRETPGGCPAGRAGLDGV